MAGNYVQVQPGVTNPYNVVPQQPYPAYNAGSYAQNGNSMGQPMQPQPNSYNRMVDNALLGWPVGSKEEALAAPTDLSGRPMYFPDRAHGAVYFKQLDFQTGASAQDVYYNAAAWQAMQMQQAAQQNAAAQAPAVQYVPMDQFTALVRRLNDLEAWKNQLEGPVENGGNRK